MGGRKWPLIFCGAVATGVTSLHPQIAPFEEEVRITEVFSI